MDYALIFESIIRDPRYQANLDWGKPRSGHPEGTVRAHIEELESNLQRLRHRVSDEDYWKLKLLIHTHDSFKAESDAGVPIVHPRSHASLAREFLASYCDDPDLLAMVQYHDEPYALWRQTRGKTVYNKQRFDDLLKNIRDWNLFHAFNIIDGCTEGKGRDPLIWLIHETADKVDSSFTMTDIL